MLFIKMSALQGREYRKNDASIKVDYNTSDPVVRWDSYENFNLHHQDSMESKKCPHTQRCKKNNASQYTVRSNIKSHSLPHFYQISLIQGALWMAAFTPK